MSYYQTMYGTDDVNTQFPIERIAKINGFTRDNGPIIELGDELIRCKDCKHWQDNNGGYPSNECKWRTDETPDADDFCSLAERKEENGK